MSILIVEATTPDVIAATPARTCDKWGTYSVVVGGEAFPVLNLSIDCKKFAADEHGVVMSPNAPVTISIPNMFAAAETNPLVEAVINSVNALVDDELTKMGLK